MAKPVYAAVNRVVCGPYTVPVYVPTTAYLTIATWPYPAIGTLCSIALQHRMDYMTEGELTPRELEILKLLADGFKPANITLLLGISKNTLTQHMHHMYQKVGCNSVIELLLNFYDFVPK